jgi:hypothetical protein
MTDHPGGIYSKDGVLILDARRANEPGVEPVIGDRYEAVIDAQKTQAAADERYFQESSDVDYIIFGTKERVKRAMQAALTKYDTENPND